MVAHQKVAFMFIGITEKVHPILQQLPMFIEKVAAPDDWVHLESPEISYWQTPGLSNALGIMMLRSRPSSGASPSQHNFSLQVDQVICNLRVDGHQPLNTVNVSTVNVSTVNVSTARTSDKQNRG